MWKFVSIKINENLSYLNPIIEHNTFASLSERSAEHISPQVPSLYTCTLPEKLWALSTKRARIPSVKVMWNSEHIHWSESFSIFKITYELPNIHRDSNSLSDVNVPVQSTPTDLSLQLALFRSALQYPMSDSLPKQPREFTRTGIFPCCDWKNEPPEL